MADAPIDASGHRARLRQRLFDGGGGALLDHELVEYLLALAIPRRDTKAQAKVLIARFGGIGPLLSADAETLRREGLTDGGRTATLECTATTPAPRRPGGAALRVTSRATSSSASSPSR